MQEAAPAFDQSHPPPPIKVYSSLLGDDGDDGSENVGDADVDADADGASLLLQSGFPQDGSFDYNIDLLSPANYAQAATAAAPQHHRRTSSASSAPVPSLDSSTSSFASSPAPGFQRHHQHHNHQHQQQHQHQHPSSAQKFPPTPNLDRPLPTPEHTPVQGSFGECQFDSYDPCSGDADLSKVDLTMKRAMLEQQQRQQQHPQQPPQVSADGDPAFPYSLAPQAPSLNPSGSPATPQTNNPGGFDGVSYGSISHGEDSNHPGDSVDRWMDECLQLDGRTTADYGSNGQTMPKLNRTYTDSVQDQLYNPIMSAIPQSQTGHPPQKPGDGHPFGSYRNVINDRLQEAHQGHMAAAQAQSDGGRQTSPFRQGSQYAPPASAYRGAHLQQPSQLASDMPPQPGLRAMDMGQGEPKTISPKDALLEYHEPSEEGNAPLFPSQPPEPSQYRSAMGGQQHHQQPPQQQQPGLPTGHQFMGVEQYRNQYGRAPQQQQQPQYYNLQQQQALQQQQQLQRQQQQQQQQQQQHSQQFPRHHSTQQRPQQPPPQPQPHQQPHQQHPANRPGHPQMDGNSNNRLVHQTPEFPASIPSIPSTNSPTSTPDDALSVGQRANEMTSSPVELAKRRPDGTSSDSGTYSCTYHGCTMRFETPARLQKHKREAHRQTTPGSQGAFREAPAATTVTAAAPGAGAGAGGGAGQSLAARNSQAGPHRCDRTNPTTGKPCNSIFSRPYDLTRHEDTIHNARKQKVHCHICTEEKSFSRNDALTRHMRVVHPEITWVGKQKRRGRD